MKKLIFLLFPFALFADSVRMINDSPFKLRAIVLSATGVELGNAIIKPRTTHVWVTGQQGISNASDVATPYTVIFYCPDGKEYGLWTNVGQSQTVNAQGAEGPKICKISKKLDQNQQQNIEDSQGQS